MLSDSPVNALSFTWREKFSIILPSATTKSPASRIKISPGTTSLEGISIFVPFLKTLALGAERAFKLFKDCSALTCCTVPSIAFKIITANITIVLSTFPVAIETIPAIISIITTTVNQEFY